MSETAEALRRWVEQTDLGDLTPLRAAASLDEDFAGHPAVFLDVVLPAPESPTETWPIKQVLSLHERINAHARKLGLELPWYVRLVPASSEADDLAEADDEE